MFLRERATQAEYFDSPDRSGAEIAAGYQLLAGINRLFHFAEPYQRLMPKFFGRDNCRSLSILDLGAGDGSLGATLSRWAADKRGWNWRFTNLEINERALRLSRSERNIAASAAALPFRDGSFDVVIASQMTHHLNHDEVLLHLREAWRVSRRGIYLTDLHRSCLLYGMIWLILHVRREPREFLEDGLLSVRRGFRLAELRTLAKAAGISNAQVSLYYASRVILQARKV